MLEASISDGIILVNKPVGWTSFDVVAKIRNTLNVKRVGHAGTLDPFATGLLIIAVGKATKILEYLVAEEKEYKTMLILGAVSTTYDTEGEKKIVSDKVPEIASIETCVEKFIGEIEQVPPIFSALKINGKKAYELARAGKAIEMKARKVHIRNIEVEKYEYPNLFLHVHCSKGTYIRSLGHDIGQCLGVGAYLERLYRSSIGEYSCEYALAMSKEITKEQLKKYMVPLSEIKLPLFSLVLNDEETQAFLHGQKLQKEVIQDGTVQVRTKDQRLIGIASVLKGSISPEKVFIV